MDLHKLNLKQAREGLKKKEFSSVDLTKACLARIHKINSQLHFSAQQNKNDYIQV